MSTPRPQPPPTPIYPAAEPSLELETLMKTFGEYTQNILDTALIQSRCESFKQEEKQIHADHDRWSKYHDDFISIGEDQCRSLKTAETAKNTSQDHLSQAKKIGVKATQQIVSSILAAAAGKFVLEDNASFKNLDRQLLSQSEKIKSLERETANLRTSAAEAQSDHRYLNKIAHDQNLLEQEISDLRESFQRKPWELDTNMEKKITELSSQVKSLTEFTSNQKEIKQNLSDIQARKFDSVKSEFQSEIKNLREEFLKCISQHDSTPARLSKLEADLMVSRESIAKLQNATADPQNKLDRGNELARFESSIRFTLQSEIKNVKDDVEKRNCLHDSTLARLSKIESDITTSRNDIVSRQKFDNTAQLVGDLKQGLASTQQTIQKVESQQQAHSSMLQRLDGVAENDSSKFKDVRSLMQKANIICETGQRIHNDHQALNLRLDSIEQQLQTQREQQPAMSNGVASDAQPGVTVDPLYVENIEGRHVALSEKFARLTGEVNIEAKLQALSKQVTQIRDDEDRRDTMAADAFEECDKKILEMNDTLKKATNDFKIQTSQFDDLKAELKRMSEDQLSTSTIFGPLQAGIAEMQEAFSSFKRDEIAQRPRLDQLQSDVSLLQRQFNNSQRPLQPSPTPSVKEDVQPKLEALELVCKHTTDKVQALESFQSSLDTRCNNITTEPIVRSVLFYLNQLYPLHGLQTEQAQLKHQSSQQSERIRQVENQVNSNRQEDTLRISKLESMKAWQDIERHGTQIVDMNTRLEQLSIQVTQTQQASALETIVENLREEVRSLQVRHNDAVAEVKKMIQNLEIHMNGVRLTQETRIKDHEDRVEEVWQHSVDELTRVDAELRALRRRMPKNTVDSDEESDVKESQSDSRGRKPHSTSIKEGESSDPEPMKSRRKRLLSAQYSSNSAPTTKRQKNSHHAESGGEDSDAKRVQASTSPQSSRKSGRVLSQQQQQQQQQAGSPSSQTRRRRKDPD
ncbi:MAG: hypothetical protein LQ341_006282 [Variospora aurantia]|nr:MAG: hypothetical protein LQ341_006282 [Variospora aurantia]